MLTIRRLMKEVGDLEFKLLEAEAALKIMENCDSSKKCGTCKGVAKEYFAKKENKTEPNSVAGIKVSKECGA